MRRRFFQRFQKRVTGFRRQHMRFVNNIYFVTTADRSKIHIFIQIFNIFYAPIRSRIQLLYIHGAAFCNLPAIQALSARLIRRSVLAVQRLGKNTGSRSLPRTPRSGKQIRMGDPPAGQCIHQRLFYRSLSYQSIKSGGSPA